MTLEQVTKESVLEKDVSGRLPIHLAFQHSAPLELIELLLKNNHPVPANACSGQFSDAQAQAKKSPMRFVYPGACRLRIGSL